MVPADSFDNVKGQFPIGFLVWDTAKAPLKPTSAINLEAFDSFGGFLGYKYYFADDENLKPIIHFLRPFYDKKNEPIAFLRMIGADFQNSTGCFLTLTLTPNDVDRVLFTPITTQNVIPIFLYLTIRHVFEHTWQNDRDQFYAPYDNAWQNDSEFKNNCLAFMLFHSQNKISLNASKTHAKIVEINHFIPFSEKEVDPKERYTSHALLDFLKGKKNEEGETLFLSTKKENKPLEFSPSALKVFDAGREIYRYYHAQDFTNTPYNANASLYDIKEFFQGRNAQGKLNLPAKAKDECYKQLYAHLQDALKDLAKEIQPKVYEYGFLRESF